MLTARDVLVLAPPGGAGYQSLGALRGAFNIRTVSLRSISEALGKQRVALAVQIRSATVLKNRSIQTLAQLQALWNDSSAMMSSDEFATLYKNLKSAGIYLKVNADKKSGILIGSATSLAAIHIVPLTDGSLQILDNVTSGLSNLGNSAVAVGGVLVALGAIPEPGSPGLVLAGAGIASFGAGILFTVGLVQLINGDDQPSTPKPTSSNDSTDDSQPDGEDISVPDGTVWGDVDGDVTKLADGIVSFDLTGTPDDFGAGQDLSIPGLGDGGGGDGSGDDYGDYGVGAGGDNWGIG